MHDPWAKAKFMCECYGYDIKDIEAGLERFRFINAPAKERALAAAKQINTLKPAPAKLAHFNSVKRHWSAALGRWTESGYVYIGRGMSNPHLNLPQSPFANPFRIQEDTDDQRDEAIELYTEWILHPDRAGLLKQLDNLRGMTLVCWCSPRRCHGDVLIQLLRERTQDAPAQLQGTTAGAALESSAEDVEGSAIRGDAKMGGASVTYFMATESERQQKL